MSFLSPINMVLELAIEPKSTVADFGSGLGAFTFELSNVVGPMGKVYAVDVHKESLISLTKICEMKSLINVDVVWADLEKEIPLDPYSLDACVIANTFFQTQNKKAVLENISKLIKPGSPVLIVEWSKGGSPVGPKSESVFSENDCQLLLQSHGFRILKRLPAGDYHYALIAIC